MKQINSVFEAADGEQVLRIICHIAPFGFLNLFYA
jgi:hypothetical protein